MLIGELSALLTAFLWSGSSFAFTAASRRTGPVQLNINRMILATLFLFITITVMNIGYSLKFDQIFYLAISGIIGLVIGDSFLFNAFRHIGARLSMLLMALSPVMSGILAYIFLGEGLPAWGIVGMAVTIGGVALVVLERSELPNTKYTISKIGILHGLLGALGQAGGLIFAKFAFQAGDINGFLATFIRILSSVLVLFPVLLLMRKYKNPIKLYAKDGKALLSTLTGTILGPYFGITFSLIAIEHAKVGIAATLMSTMPIIMLPMVRFIFKEKLTWRAITGAIIAVGGVAILFLR